MKILLIVGSGSFTGGVLRYLMSQFIQSNSQSGFPFGTLLVNIIGCLVIGAVAGAAEKTGLSPELKMFLATGLCGGFTTFSAFSNETLSLMRGGQYLFAGSYIGLSLLLGLSATFLGYIILRAL